MISCPRTTANGAEVPTMFPVIKRFLFLAVASLVLAGCAAGGDRVAVSADGQDLTRSELIDFLEVGIGQPYADEAAPLRASDLRAMAAIHIYNVGLSEFFADAGVEMTADERANFEAQVTEQSLPIDPDFADTPGFEFWVTRLWVDSVPPGAYFDDGLPGVFSVPPTLESTDQLRIPDILAIPEVVANPDLLESEEFIAVLLAEPSIVGVLQDEALLVRRREIVNEYATDINVESRIGAWDPDLGQVVAR